VGSFFATILFLTCLLIVCCLFVDCFACSAKLKKVAVDVQSIYAKPPIEISEKQSKKFIKEANESLKSIQGYVLCGGQFKKLPTEELGLFYKFALFTFAFFLFSFFYSHLLAFVLSSGSVYVFMCSYYVFDEKDDESEEESEEEEDAASETKVDYTLYFWQGKHGQAPSLFFLFLRLHLFYFDFFCYFSKRHKWAG